jgi:hypothetical protein
MSLAGAKPERCRYKPTADTVPASRACPAPGCEPSVYLSHTTR